MFDVPDAHRHHRATLVWVLGTAGVALGTAVLGVVALSTPALSAPALAVPVVLLAASAAMLVERHRARASRRRVARALSDLTQEVLLIQRDGIVLEINEAGGRLFKMAHGDIVGRPLHSFFSDDSAPVLMRRERCPAHERRPEELTVANADGSLVAVELSCRPIDYLGKLATAVALRNLSDSKRDEARVRHLARHDALTNLSNRYTLQERLDVALESAAQTRSRLAVVYLDLDRFKPVNDLYGHAVGDALLVQVAARILAQTRPTDTLARIGGDEFVMVLTGGPQPEQASFVAARVVDALRRPFIVEGKRLEIGASIGIALYPDDGTDPETLLRLADIAMYRAKDEGRGTLRLYEAGMNAELTARLLLERELAGAVARGELVLHYQPIVNGVTGEIEAFEALVRWERPGVGLVPPATFLPLAEQTGLIVPIGRWVIETACRDAAGWAEGWRVSVNVSPGQFRQADLCDVVGGALRANALDAARLVVEVTERVLLDDAIQAVATLHALRAMGVRLALDDFGTGRSSLSDLRLFRFDTIKVDKSFVLKLGACAEALTLTRTIVDLGHNLGLHVTAEGVETPEQLAILQVLGCDQMQGYLVARPSPLGAFTPVDRLRTRAMFGTGLLECA